MDKDKAIQEGKFFAAISYVSFLCIVALVLKKDNEFALYHAKQGLVLFVLEVAAFILCVIPLLSKLQVFGLAAFVLISIYGVFQAARGSCNRFPVLSAIADKVTL